MTDTLPVWRSLLFVPVTARHFVDGAARRGADAIILSSEHGGSRSPGHCRPRQGTAESVGAVTVDGKMIDVPVVARARLLIEREQAIAARGTRIQTRP